MPVEKLVVASGRGQPPVTGRAQLTMCRGSGAPLKRLGEAEDVADPGCFLASERAPSITGTAIDIDEGSSGAV